MRAHLQRIVVAASLVAIGCVTGQVASTFVAPPARAANVQRWEYHCFEEQNQGDIVTKSNQMGEQGWEMSSAAGYGTTYLDKEMIWCFKRPKS
jgi:hypothetical protein